MKMPFSIDAIYDALRQSGPAGDGKFYALTRQNRIEVQLDTPRLWGRNPAIMDYIPAAKNLTDAIELLISTAQKTVDISVLFPFPTGRFFTAIRNGIMATQKPLQVRITAGFYYPIQPPLDPVPLIDGFIESLGLPPNVSIHVAGMQTWATSWNHSKLIIVDGLRAISGGHNMWSDDYTQFAPVSDVSFQFSGLAVKTGENFINNIWTRMWYDVNAQRQETPPLFWSRRGLQGTIGPSPQVIFNNEAVASGGTHMLALGRVGIDLEPLFPLVASDNASQLAKIVAVQMYDGHIRMSQQMLGGSPLGEYDAQFFPVLRDHIIAGRDLSLIISDTNATTQTHDSYSGDGIEATARHFAQAIRDAKPEMPREELIALLRSHLRIGPTRIYNRQPDDPAAKSWMWRNGQGEALEPANHAKIMIFGEEGFYFGSDNAYAMPFNPFGMQEFGYMVEGQVETSNFMLDYWGKAWEYSSQFQVTDWERIVDETSETPAPERRLHPT
jgi:hypothetical protein